MSKCLICKRKLNNSDDLLSLDCGGDCLKCMADAGDPECIAAVAEVVFVVRVYKPYAGHSIIGAAEVVDVCKDEDTAKAVSKAAGGTYQGFKLK